MRQALELHWGNPSSVHRIGQHARHLVERARSSLAHLLSCRPRGLLFARPSAQPPLLITARTEHSATRQTTEALTAAGAEVHYLSVGPSGLVDPAELQSLLSQHRDRAAPVLVSLQWANNETGVIQSVDAISNICRGTGRNVTLHLDATQAVGKIPVNLAQTPAALLTLAAHKFHGPKGVGALFVRSGLRLRPLLTGGPQERELRGGTENIPGIVGLGAAADLAAEFLVDEQPRRRLQALRDDFERQVLAACPETVVNAGSSPRLWNTSNLAFPRLEAEAIVVALSERGVCASAGAACSSGSLEPSPVLLAMGLSPEFAHGSVRFSLSRYTNSAEINAAVQTVVDVVSRLRRQFSFAGTGGSRGTI